jgi:hypothetical protein
MIGKDEMMAQRKAGPSCLGPASLFSLPKLCIVAKESEVRSQKKNF